MEALGIAWPFDDFEAEPFLRGGTVGLIAPIAAIGEDQLQPREAVPDAVADLGKAVSILNIGGMNHQDERQAERVGEQVTLAANSFLAGVIAPDSTGLIGLDALAVDDRRSRGGFLAGLLARHHQERHPDVLPSPEPSEPAK